MGLSETVFHLVYMQVREEREAADCQEHAAKRGLAAGRKETALARAENHEAKAAALGVAIAALVDLP